LVSAEAGAAKAIATAAPAASHIANLFAAKKFELITSPSGGKPPVDFAPY
jgi:hypothetical protein